MEQGYVMAGESMVNGPWWDVLYQSTGQTWYASDTVRQGGVIVTIRLRDGSQWDVHIPQSEYNPVSAQAYIRNFVATAEEIGSMTSSAGVTS